MEKITHCLVVQEWHPSQFTANIIEAKASQVAVAATASIREFTAISLADSFLKAWASEHMLVALQWVVVCFSSNTMQSLHSILPMKV
jgi:hypothetical protein